MDLKLTDLSIFNSLCLINGSFTTSMNLNAISVFNPFNNKWLADIPDLTYDQVLTAIESAGKALLNWKDTSPYSRREKLHQWKTLILENIEPLSAILVSEQGKPYSEAISELKYSLSFLDFFSDEAIRIYGESIPSPFPNSEVMVIKEPIGVVGIITPWNFPAAMLMRKVAACLAAGCTCVVKPDERTPLSAFSLMKLAVDAGIPAGVINCITGDPALICDLLCTNKIVKKISFTGSTLVGKKVMNMASDTVKSLSLELGGNAPFLIFNDADVKRAIDGLMVAKFRNSGQTCISANRVYIHSSIYNECISYLLSQMAKLKMGSGFDPNVSIGPIIDAQALTRIEKFVDESVNLGAKIIFGGGRWEENLNFYKPTVIVDVCDHMPVMQNEIFGPILSISTFYNDAEALARANDSIYGLACYLYTNDLGRILFFENQLQFGMISVNSGAMSSAFIPFGGIKESGFGKEGSKYGMNEFLISKCVCRHS